MNTTSRESVSKTDERIDKLADQLSTLVEIVSKKVVTPAPVKAVEETCVTCGGAHSWYNCPTTDNNQASVCATTGTYNQVNPPNRVSNQMAPGFAPVQNNGQNRFNQNQGQGNNFNRGNNFHVNQGFQNNHAPNFQNQGFQNQPFQVPNNQVQQEISNDFSSYKRNNDQMLRNMQNQINSLKGDLKNEIQNTIKSQQAVMMNQQTTFQNNLQNMICGLFQNQASTSGTLPSNTIPNPKGEIKAITTRSGVAYEGPSIPTNPSPKKVVERETEETTDKEQSNFQGSTAQIPPLVTPIPTPEPDVPKTLPKTTPIPEPDVPKSLPKPNIPYPSRRDDQKSRDKASNQMEKIFQIFQDLRFDISFADALLLMPRFAPTIKSLLMNKEKLLELAKIPLNENCSAMLLKKLPEKLGDPGKAHKERQKQEEATSAALAEEFDEIQARIDAGHELAVRLTHEEQEKYTIEERARLLVEFFERRNKQLAAERAEAIRNKPPTRTQVRNRMITYLKHMRPRADSKEEKFQKQKQKRIMKRTKRSLRDSMIEVSKNLQIFSEILMILTDRYVIETTRYVVPTGRVKVPAGRYVVPTGKDKFIVSAGRTKVIPAVLYNLNKRKDLSKAGPTVLSWALVTDVVVVVFVAGVDLMVLFGAIFLKSLENIIPVRFHEIITMT
ncbi:hypothetical protein Tco_1205703 [Tanacetum coccineum]